MNIFEHAMKMEKDGIDYYLDHARQTRVPALRRILEDLAEDEQKHYNLFKQMRDNQLSSDIEGFSTSIISTTENIFDTMKKEPASVATLDIGSIGIWEHAMEVEQEAELFYRQQAKQEKDVAIKKVFDQIADEEHRHYVALDSVVKFMREPQQWLENAEWNSLTE